MRETKICVIGLGYVGLPLARLFSTKYPTVGFTFKENCPDVRNTKVIDIYRALKEYNLNITVYDPWANPTIVEHEYGIQVMNELHSQKFDACLAAVAHKKFEGLDILNMLKEKHVVFDVKCTLDRKLVDGRL